VTGAGPGIDAIIRRRRMTRRFSPEPLERSEVDQLLDLARRAPSAGFSQGVSFLALDGPAVARFWEVSGSREWFGATAPGVLAAPVIVLPLADRAAYTTRYAEPDKAGHGLESAAAWPVPYWLTDAAMATQNLLLLAEDRGLGALLFGLFRHADRVLADLGVPAGFVALGAVALGRRAPDDVPVGSSTRRPRRPLVDVVRWNRW
jgi:nitroreductase